MVAILFCFLNSEVWGELQKVWSHFKSRHRYLCGKRSSPNKRISVSSDTAITYACHRHGSSNGLLNISVGSDNRSIKRDVPIPAAIDEEDSKFLSGYEREDNNHNTEMETFVIK